MLEKTQGKIVYLLGAGATHAEMINLQKHLSENFLEKNGLLISHVSQRVIKKFRTIRTYLKDIEMVSSPKGSLNIELLISLIEHNNIKDADKKTRRLKNLVRKDISFRLTKSRLKRFYLHKALLELHSKTKEKETLLGIISLNYDHVIDEAFNWRSIKICGRKRTVPIIPLGVDKNYLQIPYNFIWGRALEILTECDILRVIGCSLSQNDIALIDLLFKAHLEKEEAFEVQVISAENIATQIKNNYGFSPKITSLGRIEGNLVPDPIQSNDDGNAFKIWLKAKASRMLKEDEIKRTGYLKKLFDL
ncbi:MAG: hypothetical protein ABSB22_17935 [Thermodesulfobacteriota bacterium]